MGGRSKEKEVGRVSLGGGVEAAGGKEEKEEDDFKSIP